MGTSPIIWKFKHVEGHKDKHTPYAQLNRQGQLNVQADTAAKKHMQSIKSGDIPLLRASAKLPLTGCTVQMAQDGL